MADSAILPAMATASAVPGAPASERTVAPAVDIPVRRLEAMFELATVEMRAIGVLIALLAMLATLAYGLLVKHRRDRRLLLEHFDRKAEKREQDTREAWARIERAAEKREQESREITSRLDRGAEQRQLQFGKEAEKRERQFQAVLERSDRTFETATAQANLLAKGLASIAQRTARNQGTLEAITGGTPRTETKSSSAVDEPRTVAAQHVPGEQPAD